MSKKDAEKAFYEKRAEDKKRADNLAKRFNTEIEGDTAMAFWPLTILETIELKIWQLEDRIAELEKGA